MLLNAFYESRANVEKFFQVLHSFIAKTEMLKAVAEVQLNCKEGEFYFN